jgi:hypothetical protein
VHLPPADCSGSDTILSKFLPLVTLKSFLHINPTTVYSLAGNCQPSPLKCLHLSYFFPATHSAHLETFHVIILIPGGLNTGYHHDPHCVISQTCSVLAYLMTLFDCKIAFWRDLLKTDSKENGSSRDLFYVTFYRRDEGEPRNTG